jgi:hypothetical protein
MGRFKLEIVAVGGHGCQRDKKDGETVYGCGHITCPDCQFFSMIAEFARKSAGCTIESATLTHWPGQPGEVVDELKKDVPLQHVSIAPRVRRGSF